MRTSQRGIDLIKKWESLSLTTYLCAAGIPTIGWGTTVYPNGKAVSLTDRAITREEAEQFLISDINAVETRILRMNLFTVIPTPNEWDALVSFCYNVGVSTFSKSSIRREFNKGRKDIAAKAILYYNKARVHGKLVVLKGLTDRRKEEQKLFLS